MHNTEKDITEYQAKLYGICLRPEKETLLKWANGVFPHYIIIIAPSLYGRGVEPTQHALITWYSLSSLYYGAYYPLLPDTVLL